MTKFFKLKYKSELRSRKVLGHGGVWNCWYKEVKSCWICVECSFWVPLWILSFWDSDSALLWSVVREVWYLLFSFWEDILLPPWRSKGELVWGSNGDLNSTRALVCSVLVCLEPRGFIGIFRAQTSKVPGKLGPNWSPKKVSCLP